jgi:hypothetical protein
MGLEHGETWSLSEHTTTLHELQSRTLDNCISALAVLMHFDKKQHGD